MWCCAVLCCDVIVAVDVVFVIVSGAALFVLFASGFFVFGSCRVLLFSVDISCACALHFI